MIIGIGVDLCAIDQMAQKMKDMRFLKRFFTLDEIAYIKNKNRAAAQSAAGIFAAKEAALKALGTGLTLSLKEVGIMHREGGQPYYVFTGKALKHLDKLGAGTMHLSISHEENMALAFAVVEN